MDEEAVIKAMETLRPGTSAQGKSLRLQIHPRPSVVFHAGGIFRRCQNPMEEMVQPNIAMAEATSLGGVNGLVLEIGTDMCIYIFMYDF